MIKNDFFEVYKHSSLQPTILLYCPTREVCICLRHGGEDRYFKYLHSALNYARQFMTNEQVSLMKAEAEKGIRYQDMIQDYRDDELHNASMRGRAIGAIIKGADPAEELLKVGEDYDNSIRESISRFFGRIL